MSRKANFARLDELYDDNRKVKRAWRRNRASVGLHAQAITYAKRHQTDGVIDPEWLEDMLPSVKEREATVSALVELGLFEVCDDGSYRVHDFLEWQVGRAEREQRAEQARSAAQARWAAQRNANSMRIASEPHSGTDSGSDATRNAEVETETEEEVSTSADADVVEPDRLDEAKTVLQLIDYWRARCGHEQAKATNDRKAKVRARLREGYTPDQIRRAIDGAATGAFTNDQGHRFDDLELVCRNGSKLEQFIARADGARSATGHIRLRQPDLGGAA